MDERRILEELTIVPLLTKYVRGEELSVLEKKTLEIWINENSYNRATYEQLKDSEQVAANLVDFGTAESMTEVSLQKLHAKLDRRQSVRRIRYWASAAAVLFMLSISVLLYKFTQNTQVDKVMTTSTDILPGKDQATLSFDNGKTLSLDGKELKTDDKGVAFLGDKAITSAKYQVAMLSTPRKGKYKTTLPDGTQVWLNAESSLKFPTQFTGKERVVELKGEGYFEVAHNASKPFIVVSKGQKVKVLGTRFNINSYENEMASRTTLVSGSVELSTGKNGMTIKLKPGQQGVFSNSKFIATTVDTETFTAWTTDEFQFKGATLTEVLRQLERWYDIDVDYSNVPNMSVHASISRQKKLSSVLYTIQKITDLKFEIKNGRRLQIIE